MKTFHIYLIIIKYIINYIHYNKFGYGVSRFDDNKNNLILSASIKYILETERFSTSLFQRDV